MSRDSENEEVMVVGSKAELVDLIEKIQQEQPHLLVSREPESFESFGIGDEPMGQMDWMSIVINLPIGMVGSMAANWIYDELRGRLSRSAVRVIDRDTGEPKDL